jgi:hypothetical protein
MRFLYLALILANVTPLPAGIEIEIEARGVRLPVFNEAGQLAHRIRAVEAVHRKNDLRLLKIVVEVLSSDGKAQVVGTLKTDEALYRKSDQTIVGDKQLVMTSPEHSVTGQDFIVDLKKSTLLLGKDCHATEKRFDLKSDSMELTYDPSKKIRKDKEEGIQTIIAEKNVIVISKDRSALDFDQATTERAVYDAISGIVEIPNEATIIRDGAKGLVDGMRIRTR